MVYQVPETDDSKCYQKAIQRNQKTFTLVEQDQTAVKTIAHWIYLNIETYPAPKLREVLEDCIKWRTYGKKKAAD